jgi:uncharacterized membrane protein YcaP (DUF421 family)
MEFVIRVTIIYLFLLVALRIMGKRELAEMSPLEFLVLMIIPEVVSQSLSDDDYSLTGAIIGVCTLLSLVFITSLISYRFKKVGEIIEGKPTILVSNGRLIRENADKERVSIEEIYSEMHREGYERLEELRWVILEPEGKLSFIPQHKQDN